MNTKRTGLADFAVNQSNPPKDSVQLRAVPGNGDTGERTRGKNPTVMISYRCPKADWPRLHSLALSEGVSIQKLLTRGLNRIFEEKGLKPMNS